RTEPASSQRAGAEALDEDVRRGGELAHQPGAVLVAQVHQQRALVAVERRVHGAVVAGDGLDRPRRVADRRLFDLHDVGAEIAEQHRRVRSRDVARQVDHAHTVERAGHRSSTIAKPMPPCAQTEIRPCLALRRAISFASVVVMRAPVAPNGCPSAIEPPHTFSFSRSSFPKGAARPSFSFAQLSDSSAWMLDATWAANASCISTRSMSASVRPARSSAFGIASAGPISNWPPGSTAATAHERMNASGV